LHGKPQTSGLSPAVRNQLLIPVIEMKIPGQLEWRRIVSLTPIAVLLVLCQELNGHSAPSIGLPRTC
jgi:hypothetical protein